ncbi:hypothetical protein [Rossellomorea aquimaris]|uniref:Uncharacterized protein n=1 Tax=Rossellomorea aquimaris TaxID=189382 RepID=A0A1J6WRD8_9BACI|nr:hypothetical protein [Rossellomorea aquimaris]OIU70795.1 hypothetical protein BHE18_20000 [Rossellomorea aquimaris]
MGVVQGCNSETWAENQDKWVGYCPNNMFNMIFMRQAFNPDITLLQALLLEGDGLEALARTASAALLNAVSPMVNYPLTAMEVIQKFQDAYDSGEYEETIAEFSSYNNMYCPME